MTTWWLGQCRPESADQRVSGADLLDRIRVPVMCSCMHFSSPHWVTFMGAHGLRPQHTAARRMPSSSCGGCMQCTSKPGTASHSHSSLHIATAAASNISWLHCRVHSHAPHKQATTPCGTIYRHLRRALTTPPPRAPSHLLELLWWRSVVRALLAGAPCCSLPSHSFSWLLCRGIACRRCARSLREVHASGTIALHSALALGAR
jgi:hypothetical protein